MQLLRTGCVVFACLAGVSLEANALTIDSGTVKDANVQSDSSGPLGGGSAILDPFTNSSYSIDSYIGFDIADFQSLGNPAVDVSLDLYGFAARTSLVLNIYGLNDLVSPDWSESTILPQRPCCFRGRSAIQRITSSASVTVLLLISLTATQMAWSPSFSRSQPLPAKTTRSAARNPLAIPLSVSRVTLRPHCTLQQRPSPPLSGCSVPACWG